MANFPPFHSRVIQASNVFVVICKVNRHKGKEEKDGHGSFAKHMFALNSLRNSSSSTNCLLSADSAPHRTLAMFPFRRATQPATAFVTPNVFFSFNGV